MFPKKRTNCTECEYGMQDTHHHPIPHTHTYTYIIHIKVRRCIDTQHHSLHAFPICFQKNERIVRNVNMGCKTHIIIPYHTHTHTRTLYTLKSAGVLTHSTTVSTPFPYVS